MKGNVKKNCNCNCNFWTNLGETKSMKTLLTLSTLRNSAYVRALNFLLAPGVKCCRSGTVCNIYNVYCTRCNSWMVCSVSDPQKKKKKVEWYEGNFKSDKKIIKQIPIRIRRRCSRHDKITVKIDMFLQRDPLLSSLSVHVCYQHSNYTFTRYRA